MQAALTWKKGSPVLVSLCREGVSSSPLCWLTAAPAPAPALLAWMGSVPWRKLPLPSWTLAHAESQLCVFSPVWGAVKSHEVLSTAVSFLSFELPELSSSVPVNGCKGRIIGDPSTLQSLGLSEQNYSHHLQIYTSAVSPVTLESPLITGKGKNKYSQ